MKKVLRDYNSEYMNDKYALDNLLIVIIGFMGSGKSVTGEIIARKLGIDFVDTDQEIERIEGMSVADIFTKKGEMAFREIESSLLASVCSRYPAVVSSGGGIILSSKNRELMEEKALVVWLKCSLDTCLQRCNGSNRPLLQGDNVLSAAESLYFERENLYSSVADLELDTTDMTPQSAAEIIAEKIMSEISCKA